MRAVLLVGHGSLRPGSGAAMIRLAARVREAGIAPLAGAGFLNYSRPRFADALERLVAQGAHDVVVQPYFLVLGAFVRGALPRAVEAAQATHPNVTIQLAEPFGDHAALAQLAIKRAAVALPQAEGLLLLAHGSPDASANRTIARVAERIDAGGHYCHVGIGYMDLNTPSIPEAFEAIIARGAHRIVAVPFFLQLGGHVAEDLPAIVAAAQTRHPAATIALAEHLGYDPLLVDVIAERVNAIIQAAYAPQALLRLRTRLCSGRHTVNVLPAPSLLTTETSPPCRVITSRTT